jgi:AcrR family transcriptional regulator
VQPHYFDDDEPFVRPYAFGDADMLTNAAIRLLADHGIDSFSVAVLARAINLTPQAVLNRYPRHRVVELLCLTFSQRWLTWATRDRIDELPARLPRTDSERHGVLVHRALHELARGEAAQGRTDAQAVLIGTAEEELGALADEVGQVAERWVSTDEVAPLHALITGLRLVLADPEPQLTWEQAAELLREGFAKLVVDNQLREEGA